ncbi:hypothetical protein [Bacillus fungorum]|uniref:hypothetical protein n=1 Tax=Bacillus fungorum TaxID=2039284 RepID=UPI003F5503E0
MITTVLAFTGGVVTCVSVYKIVSIIKNERKDKKSLVSDVKRLKDKVRFMEMDLDWMKVRAEYWEKCSFELHDLKSDVELIKSGLEEGNTEDK